MSMENVGKGQDGVPGVRRKGVPLAMARGPFEYTPGDQAGPVQLTSMADVGTTEQLMGLEPPRRAQYIRLLVGEMQRIGSHLIAVGTYLLDLGAFTPVL